MPVKDTLLKNQARVIRKIAGEHIENVRRRFDRGVWAEGDRLPDLTLTTRNSRPRAGRGGPPMQNTGELARSFRVVAIGDDGFDASYAGGEANKAKFNTSEKKTRVSAKMRRFLAAHKDIFYGENKKTFQRVGRVVNGWSQEENDRQLEMVVQAHLKLMGRKWR